MYTIAHLSSLVYLDYRLIDNEKREEALEQYRDSIDELVHDETALERKQKVEEEKVAQTMLYKVGELKCTCFEYSIEVDSGKVHFEILQFEMCFSFWRAKEHQLSILL